MEHDNVSSQHDYLVGLVNVQHLQSHGWVSDSSNDYIVMSIRKKKEDQELKMAGVRLPIKINGKSTIEWIDNGSPISFFAIGELKRTLGTKEVKLKVLGRTMINSEVTEESAETDGEDEDAANFKWEFGGDDKHQYVIGGYRPSTIGRDLMP